MYIFAFGSLFSYSFSMKAFGLLFALVMGFFSTVFASTGISFTGDLVGYLDQQQSLLEKNSQSVYDALYKNFQSSSMNLLKTLEYKSLVCLGVMKDNIIVQDLQNDYQKIKLIYLTTISQIQSDISDLEEKNRIKKQSGISLFASGTTYESEQQRILQRIVTLITTTQNSLEQFKTQYQLKIDNFGKDLPEYVAKNAVLVSGVKNQILAYEAMKLSFDNLSSDLIKMNGLLLGAGSSFFDQLEKVKATSTANLDLKLQGLIAPQIKRYKILKTLSGDLLLQKDYALRLYALDFDEKFNGLMLKWYSNNEYKYLKQSVLALQQNYVVNTTLQCNKILASNDFSNQLTGLQKRITDMQKSLKSGLQVAQGSGTSVQFMQDLQKWFMEYSTSGLQVRVNEFRKVMNDKIKLSLDEYRKQQEFAKISVNTGSGIVPQITVNSNFAFTQPFKKNQYSEDVKILQQLLTTYGFYNGEINGVYSPKTIEAVYNFQLKNGLLVGYDKKPQTWGWMGPATRKALNGLLIK